MLKLNLTLVGVLALIFSSSFVAFANDSLNLDSDLGSQLAYTEQQNTMTWPMLPGESLNDVARLFYPNSKTMQQQFVAKTLKLSADAAPNLKPTEHFKEPTLLVVPTLKSLSKNAPKKVRKTNQQTLKMSYGLKQIVENVPQKLLQEYDELVNKNAFLKEQLVKLNEKIVFLETKLVELKLIFDKTLTLPNSKSGNAEAQSSPVEQNISQPATPATEPLVSLQPEASNINNDSTSGIPAAKKVFKNLNQAENTTTNKNSQSTMIEAPKEPAWFDNISGDFVKVALTIVCLLLLAAFLLKKYRERMFAKLSFTATKIQNTVTDFSGYFEKEKVTKEAESPEAAQQIKAAKEVETRLSATLEEAKLLMSVNRGTDAIAHLKMTIQSQPKASINHWLYLLEVFRKLNLKDEFEEYADNMHDTFNVMTPVWYEKEAAINTVMIVPQSLEEFPHIMEQLYGVWPGELATVYLRSLITDNRGGERVGFGKTVISEILLLIALLDTHKELPN